jgi:hypothetical protein
MMKHGSSNAMVIGHRNNTNHHLSYTSSAGANEDDEIISMMQSMMIPQNHIHFQPLQIENQ